MKKLLGSSEKKENTNKMGGQVAPIHQEIKLEESVAQ